MYRYIVLKNQELTPTTLLLTLKKSSGSKPFSFQPGQYAAISFIRNGRPTPARSFSIVSSPTDSDTLQFSVRIKGRFTNALSKLVEGDEVTVRGPFGAFVYDIVRDTDAVLIAGGIGITPFISMIGFATNHGLANKINLVYSCKDQLDVPFVDEITNFENLNLNFKSTLAISEGPTNRVSDSNVCSGRVTPEIIDQVVNGAYENKSYFICGPPLFMNAMTSLLLDKGVPSDRIITEAFSQGSRNQTGKIHSWPINVYAFGAMGMVLSSFVIMVNDLLKNLPASTSFGSTSLIDSLTLTSSRQAELDSLINKLPSSTNSAPATDAAIQTTNQQANTGSTSTSNYNPSSNSTTSPSPVPTPAPAPTPTPTPAPAPTPCTTQSGNLC